VDPIAGGAATADLGNRLGVATLLMLISLVGGRIVPSFTRNWLAKQRPDVPAPASFDALDRAVLALVAIALAVWVAVPDSIITSWVELAAGVAVGVRLVRWRGAATLREPLLWVLHLGYGWLALGFVLSAASGLMTLLPPTTALRALTTGAIGTMTLAVMTRASLGHTGHALIAGPRLRAGDARRALAPSRAHRRKPLCLAALRRRSGVECRVRTFRVVLCAAAGIAARERRGRPADLMRRPCQLRAPKYIPGADGDGVPRNRSPELMTPAANQAR